MGLPCSTAACYRRFTHSEEYDEDAIWYSNRNASTDTESFLNQQLGKFHYEVNALSLMLPPYGRCETKAIYLYIDGVRVAAARLMFEAFQVKYVSLEYRSVYWRDLYHDTAEYLPKNQHRYLQKHFSEYFKWFSSSESDPYRLRWMYTMYKSCKSLSDSERESILSSIEISI